MSSTNDPGVLTRLSVLDVRPMEYDADWHEATIEPARVVLWRDPAKPPGESEWVIVHVEVDGKDLMGVMEGTLPPVDEDHPLFARLTAEVARV